MFLLRLQEGGYAMLYKLGKSIKKELLLQVKDVGGLIILFVMPLLLLVTITMVQKGSFDSIIGTRISILFVDNDGGEIGEIVREELAKSGSFEIVEKINTAALSEEAAKEAVFKGDYQLAIVLPADLSKDLDTQIKHNVDRIMQEFDYATTEIPTAVPTLNIAEKEVNLYFDPATQESFKTAIKSSIDKLIATVEKDKVYAVFQQELGVTDSTIFTAGKLIHYKEISSAGDENLTPSAVQHNVPAWTLFAIFFIIVPLSINIVKEKSQGTMIRLITNPAPYSLFLLGKTFTYLLISLIQFYIMLLTGMYLFPLLGLPAFVVSHNFLELSVLALFSGLAAIGLGIALGTIASTQEQSAPFGATLVVILAAIGGIWVPVFIMPAIMQTISMISPMNWALNGFYTVLLRQGSWTAILPDIILLFLFFVLTLGIAILYDKKKRTV